MVKPIRKRGANGRSGPEANVCIAIPSGPQWYGEFAMCVIQMVLDTVVYPTPGWGQIGTQIRNIRGSTIWKQRTDLIKGAIETGCSHLLFVDTDQTFPANTIRRLICHKEPVVACNITVKQIPPLPTARRLINGEPCPIFTTVDSHGLEEIWRIGTGVMMIDLAIMSKVEEPWFKVSWGGEGEQYGEDWWFCSQLEKAGIPIYIDHNLSWEVGHIGSLTFSHHQLIPGTKEIVYDIIEKGTKEEKSHLQATLQKRLEEKHALSSEHVS